MNSDEISEAIYDAWQEGWDTAMERVGLAAGMRQLPTGRNFAQEDDWNDSTAKVEIKRVEKEHQESEKQAKNDLYLWGWIHTEMECHLIQDSIEGHPWLVCDVDGDEIGRGASPIEAMQDAEKKILQIPGHECI